MASDFTFDPVEVDPDESRPVELDLFSFCANYWQPGEIYDAAEVVRPSRPTGFAYQSGGGTSAAREPIWPRVLSATVPDGSVTWTCVAADETNGINAITSPSATSDPVGLTISSVSVDESTKILATYSGGTLDQDYEAVFSFTLNGVPRVARQLVQMRKR